MKYYLYRTLREANIARQGEWDPDSRISLSYRGNELAGETGEACNAIKKLDREIMGLRGSRATNEDLGSELADVVICADLIAMDRGIDLLYDAVPAKFNHTSAKYGLSHFMQRSLVDPVTVMAEALTEIAAYDDLGACKRLARETLAKLGFAPTSG